MSVEPIFAANDVLERVDGDVEFLKELSTEFLASFPAQFEGIVVAARQNENSQLSKKAHSIKGALKNLGAMHSGAVASAIEKNAEAGNMAVIDQLLVQLEAGVKDFERELNQFFARS